MSQIIIQKYIFLRTSPIRHECPLATRQRGWSIIIDADYAIKLLEEKKA